MMPSTGPCGPCTVTWEASSSRRSTPPQAATRRKPRSSMEVTIRPISSRWASSTRWTSASRRGGAGPDGAQEVAKPVQSRLAVGGKQLHGGLGGRVLQAGDTRPLGETL